MTIKQAYDAYIAERNRIDAGKHGASLRMMSPKEEELYDAWKLAIKNCTVWRSSPDAPCPNTTWHVLDRYQDGDLEMWHCRIEQPGKPDEIADCYAWAIREQAAPAEQD